jgi:citrate lyase synthetase
MNAEIMSTKQKSLDIINSVDYHRALVEQYDKLLSEFNPEMAEKQAQQQEIASLRMQMDQMSKNMALLIEQLKNNKDYAQTVGN